MFTAWKANLPSELIYRILEYLDLRDLLAPLAVSRHWRRVALDHPTYWRHLCLRSTSDNAVDLFLARFAHARGRKVSIEINVSEPCPRISADVLPAIAARMDQVQLLSTALHREQADDLFATVCQPAAVLEFFDVFIRSPSSLPLPVLPTDAFVGKTPKLAFVGFRDVGLLDATYPAFSNVSRVEFGFTRTEGFYLVPTLFVVFPNMRRFALHSGRLRIPRDFAFPANIPPDVEALNCVMDPDSIDLTVGVIPYESIPTVRVNGAGNDVVVSLVQQLRGDLSVDIVDCRHICRELFDICVTSTETGFQRIFAQSARQYLAGVIPPVSFLRDPDFAERVVKLTIPNTLWGFLTPHLLPFLNLKELVIRFDSSDLPVLDAKWSIYCSKLQRLRLVTGMCDPVYVQTEKLAAFVAVSLRDIPTSSPPLLELEGVILEGKRDILCPHLCMPSEAEKTSLHIPLPEECPP